MRTCAKTYTIMEYGGFTRGEAAPGYQALPIKTFDALESFILSNCAGEDKRAIELLSLSARRGFGKIITARNYVGLITMKDGTVIEILPKIAGNNVTESDTKRIFIEMLKSIKDICFKDFNPSTLKTERLSVLEIFIKMFLDEVAILTKQGLKAAYNPIECNERFYKGKLLVSQNVRHNLVRKERFFVQYDEFNINRAENRLIKSTLAYLLKQTSDWNNRQNAARLLTFFDGVDYSVSYEVDFSKSILDRSMNHYDKALSWCRVFLKGNSFTAFTGSEIAIALLFPMEKVFESFVATKFRKHINGGTTIWTQDNRYCLFDSPTRAFALRPDIVLEKEGLAYILDTKWKLLSDNDLNSGISQSDMYQMYAYSKKYEADRVVLLYPHSDSITRTNIKFAADDNVRVDIKFIDLMNPGESVSKLIQELSC